jgi:hypothetical protein
MKTLILAVIVSLVGLALIGPHSAVSANPAAAAKQFAAKLVISQTKEGKTKVIAEPTLIALEGQDAAYLSGGEVPVDPAHGEFLEFGTKARVRVREIAPNRLRVAIYAGQSDVEPLKDGDVIIRETGVHYVKTVAPGERFEIELGTDRKAVVTISRANVAP